MVKNGWLICHIWHKHIKFRNEYIKQNANFYINFIYRYSHVNSGGFVNCISVSFFYYVTANTNYNCLVWQFCWHRMIIFQQRCSNSLYDNRELKSFFIPLRLSPVTTSCSDNVVVIKPSTSVSIVLQIPYYTRTPENTLSLSRRQPADRYSVSRSTRSLSIYWRALGFAHTPNATTHLCAI